jgi:hypothetical protein
LLQFLAAADPAPAQRADANDSGQERDADLDREMDFEDQRDFADQDPLTDMEMEQDALIIATLLKHTPSCMNADHIEQLVQDIPVQPLVVVPVTTVQQAVAAGDLWMWMQPTFSHRANPFCKNTSANTVPTLLRCKI